MELHYFKTLPSTSLEAAAQAKKGAPHLYTVIAEEQSAGRGRMQRRFFSPHGGLYFSTVLRTALPMSKYTAITPFAALAVRLAIQSDCGLCVDVKWVNDLLYQGRKICGILAESGVDQNGASYVILGIGINTHTVDFPPELAEIAASIPCPDREALLRCVLQNLASLDKELERGAWRKEYRAACSALGKEVLVIGGEVQKKAIAQDILADGALRVLYPDGTCEDLHGAEISLRMTQTKKN